MIILPADLIFSRMEADPVSLGIRYFDGGPWSHVELAEGLLDFPKWKDLRVISAEAQGVVSLEKDLSKYTAFSVLRHIDPCMTMDDRMAVVKEARKLIGAGYDYQGFLAKAMRLNLEDPERHVCSEVVYLAYKRRGWVLITRLMDGELVTPHQLWNSVMLTEVST